MSKYIISFIIVSLLPLISGCRTLAIERIQNPVYGRILDDLANKEITPDTPTKEEVEKALEGIEPMVVKAEMDLSGVGKNKANFDKRSIENDSGIKIPELPKLEFDN